MAVFKIHVNLRYHSISFPIFEYLIVVIELVPVIQLLCCRNEPFLCYDPGAGDLPWIQLSKVGAHYTFHSSHD
jgi:hypothetical protein